MGFVDNKGKKKKDISPDFKCLAQTLLQHDLCFGCGADKAPSGNSSREVLGVNFDRVTLKNLSTRI